MIPHSKPTFTIQDRKALSSVAYLSQGPAVARFERQFARLHGKNQAVAVSSGTAALHLALLALKIKKGDEVLIPSYVCTALLNAVHYVGATPKIVDVEAETGNMSLEDAGKKCSKKTKCLILPHMFGQPIDVTHFKRLGLPIIEDCAQSIGAKVKNKRVGTIGDIGIFSFYATKMMATGEGGMVLARSSNLLKSIRDSREYDHKKEYKLRYNYKMTDIQAALGSSQLRQLNAFIRKRRNLAKLYKSELKGLPLEISGSVSIYFRFIFKTSHKDKLQKYLKARGVAAENPVYKPIHQYLNKKGFPEAERWYKQGLSIPIYPVLSLKEATRITQVIRGFFK